MSLVAIDRPPFEAPIVDAKGNLTPPWAGWLARFISLQTAMAQLALTVGTNSISKVSTGFGVKAPLASRGRLLIAIANVYLVNAAAGVGVFARLFRTTGTIPTAGNPPNAGDVEITAVGGPDPTAAGTLLLPFALLDQPLQKNTQYSYYLTLETLNAANQATLVSSVENPPTMTVTEF
jgi:hypothetical protein